MAGYFGYSLDLISLERLVPLTVAQAPRLGGYIQMDQEGQLYCLWKLPPAATVEALVHGLNFVHLFVHSFIHLFSQSLVAGCYMLAGLSLTFVRLWVREQLGAMYHISKF